MWAAKLSQRNRCPVDAAKMKAHQGKGVEPQRVNTPDDDFQVIGEPLYGGKGKSSGLIYNHCDFPPLDTRDHAGGQPSPSTITDTAFSADPETAAYAGLNQPRLQSSNSVVLGEAKKQMRCENKQRRQALRPNKRSYPHGHNIRDWWIPSHLRITQHAPLIKIPCAQMG
jgi:hypothetical protein